MDTPMSPTELDALESRMDAWFAARLAHDPAVAAVERGEPDIRRWYVRLHGEAKDVYSIWFTLGQRVLHVETYFMPAPEENEGELYRHLLVRNAKLRGLSFGIGEEDAVFLLADLPNEHVDDDALDRILGSFVAAVEQCFGPAIRLGFASRF